MKHSASDSMTEILESKVVIPCTGSCESVLQKLCVDLCNLIVESRIPGFSEKGYGDGIHCPPLLGGSTHMCDLAKIECQKHQKLIHHLLRGIGSHFFEIEVLLLPDCCAESKLKERIQKKEYLLLEKWSMKCICRQTQTAFEVSHLLRAVRSFLHFSQLSAWLSSSKGKSPLNIYYWVKPSFDGLSTTFEQDPEVHSFPLCKISEDLYGSVKVKYPPRTQYVPIIPCSKHPPLHGYSFRTLNENSNLHPSLPLNPQIVRQLHKTTFDQHSVKSYVSEPATLLLTPASLLKTFSDNISEGNKSKRVLKHSNCQIGLISTSTLSFDLRQNKNLDAVSKSQTSQLCNYTESFSNGLSQENVCYDKNRLSRHLHQKVNRDSSIPREVSASVMSSNACKPIQNKRKRPLKQNNASFSTSQLNITSNNIKNIKTQAASPIKEINLRQESEKKKKASKRKDLSSEKAGMLPLKKLCCDINVSSRLYEMSSNHLNEVISQSSVESSQAKIENSVHLGNRNLEQGKIGRQADQSECIKPEIKTSKPNISQEKNSQPSKGLSLSSMFMYSTKKIANVNNSGNSTNNEKYFRKRTFEEANFLSNPDKTVSDPVSKLNYYDSVLESESAADFNENNEQKKKKSENEYSSLASNSSSYLISKKSKRKRKQTYSRCKLLHKQNLSAESNEGKTLSLPYCNIEIGLQNNELLKKNELKASSSSLNTPLGTKPSHLDESYPEKNLRDTKLLQCDRILIVANQANCEENECNFSKVNCKTNLRDFRIEEPDKTCTKNLWITSRNSICALGGKNRSNTREKIKNIKTAFKNLKKSRETFINTLQPILTKRSDRRALRVRNKSHKIGEKKYKSSKTERPNNKSASSHASIIEEKVPMASQKCQCRSTKQILKTYTRNNTATTAASTSTNVSYDVKEKMASDAGGNCCNSILQLEKISHQNDRQCSFLLNRLVPSNYRSVLCGNSYETLDRFPRHIPKFPKGRKLIANFEESILKGCLPPVNSVKGFHAEIGASGSFFPNHLTLPADVSFYELGNSHQGAAPYVAHVILGDAEYYLPRKGAVQVTLFNPSETVVKMFILNYDLSSMPPMCHTFIRQKIYYLPVGSTEEYPSSQQWLRFIIHLRFASSKTGKIFLHEDFKIVVLNKTNDDAASEFSQEPRELRSFLSVPKNPTFSNF